MRAVTYKFTFGDGHVVSGTEPTVSYHYPVSTDATNTVTLTVTDAHHQSEHRYLGSPVTRRLATFFAVLTLVASLFGAAMPVAASTPLVEPTIAHLAAPAPAAAPLVNAPPVAVDDPAIPSCFTGEFGGSFPLPEDWHQVALTSSCAATANDTDSDGTIVSWHVDTFPAHGVLEWAQDFPAAFGYTPDPNWSTLPGNVPGGSWVFRLVHLSRGRRPGRLVERGDVSVLDPAGQ